MCPQGREHRRHEALRLGIRMQLPHAVDKRGRPAHVHLVPVIPRSSPALRKWAQRSCPPEVGDRRGEVLSTEAAVQVRARGRPAESVQHRHVRHRLRDLGELLAVARLVRRPRVVKEGHLSGVMPRAQCAQHRHHRGDAAAARDEQDAADRTGRQRELATDGVQADDHAFAGVLEQERRDQAAVVAADGELDQPVGLGVGRRVRPGAATAVDLDRQVDVLAGAESGERTGWGRASA